MLNEVRFRILALNHAVKTKLREVSDLSLWSMIALAIFCALALDLVIATPTAKTAQYCAILSDNALLVQSASIRQSPLGTCTTGTRVD
jgi:hypothetical protein